MKKYFLVFISLFTIYACSKENGVGNGGGNARAVDLGLSVKWASSNLCTTGVCANPEEYGDYFAWGETSYKYSYSWVNYKYGFEDNYGYIILTKYNTKSSYGTVDNKIGLEADDDAAHVVLGGKWRMPTDTEWTELRETCNWTWTSDYNGKGVAGYIVTSNKTGYTDKSIFLPAAGYRSYSDLNHAGSYGFYWSSSLFTDSPYRAWGVQFGSRGVKRSDDVSTNRRYYGLSVRPVTE